MGDLKEGTADLSDYIRENLPEWKEKFQDFAETAAVKISEVIDKAKEFAGAIRDNWPQIRDTAIRVGAAFIILRGALLALQVVNTVAAAFRTFRAVLLAVRGTQIGLNLAMMANPIGLIIGLIAD
ncbi:YtxH domain-containing protein [Alteribacillus bidgolensis]|nr:YtxH domain-containing protein [Alteribacillus bidgolensis]